MRCKGTAECGERCLKVCPRQALEYGETREDAVNGGTLQLVHVKRELCDNCGKCEEVCYPGALSITGKDYTVDELVKRLLRDRRFYETSGGGITVSGGEALSQADFTREVLKRMKEEGIHTALDTTGFAKWEVVESVLPYVDLFLYDLKHMDSAKHRAVVGVPNEPILENARRLAAAGAKLQIRIPVIPMFNHDEANIRKTAEFCQSLGEAVQSVQLLPYHNMGVTKYLRISDKPVAEATPPSEDYMKRLQSIMSEYGLHVTIH